MNIEISWQRFSKPSRIHWKKIHKKKKTNKKKFSVFKKKNQNWSSNISRYTICKNQANPRDDPQPPLVDLTWNDPVAFF